MYKGAQGRLWMLGVLACALALVGCGEDGGDGGGGGGDTSGSSGADTSGSSGADTSGSSGADTSGTSGGCGAVTPQGACEGTELTWCSEDPTGAQAVATFDCANLNSACGVINTSYGYDCIAPAGGACDGFNAPFCAGAGAACVRSAGGQEVCVEESGLACNPSQSEPTCQGDTLVYECYQGHTVIATDCASLGSVCAVIEGEATCVTAAGGDCRDTLTCGGTNPACILTASGVAQCQELPEALPCDSEQAVPTCEGALLVTSCYLGTLVAVDCESLGGACDPGDPADGGASCVNLPEGSVCAGGIADCAEGLTCAEPPAGQELSTCQPEAPAP
jgi:hypothetical protein